MKKLLKQLFAKGATESIHDELALREEMMNKDLVVFGQMKERRQKY